jgi:hypothetical protein
MKKSKLTLEKFRIVELKNSSHIFGGTVTLPGTDSSICDTNTNPITTTAPPDTRPPADPTIATTAETRTDNGPDVTNPTDG